jgi:hypothetical protein
MTARSRWTWSLAFMAFFLVSAGWAVALPPNGTNDEDQHILRAYAVASGQFWSPPASAARGGGTWVDAPRSLLPAWPNCTHDGRPQGATCQGPASEDTRPTPVGTAAGRYNPLYYLPVGLPMVVSPHHSGVVAGRLVSGALTAACLATAFTIAWRWRRPLMVAGVMVVATPNLLNLGGSINPSGLELAAAVLLWSALLPIVSARDGELSDRAVGRLLVAAAVGCSLVVSLRTLGPLLAGLTLVACAAFARPGRLDALRRRPEMPRLVAGVGAVTVLAGLWILGSGVLSNPPQPTKDYTLSDKAGYVVADRLTGWVVQVIGRFSYGEVTVPNAVLVGWYVLALLLVAPALLLATRRQLALVLGVFATTVVLLVGFELAYVDHLGWAQQSRYFLPFGIGTVLAAASLPHWPERLGPEGTARLVQAVAAGTALMHVWSLAAVMSWFQTGQREILAPLSGVWLPASGPRLPLTAAAIGAFLVAGLGWAAALRPDLLRGFADRAPVGGARLEAHRSPDAEAEPDGEPHASQDERPVYQGAAAPEWSP